MPKETAPNFANLIGAAVAAKMTPIPCRNSDWHFYHDSYDGAPDANDGRAGHAESIDGCLREIAEIEGWQDAADTLKTAIAAAEGGE